MIKWVAYIFYLLILSQSSALIQWADPPFTKHELLSTVNGGHTPTLLGLTVKKTKPRVDAHDIVCNLGILTCPLTWSVRFGHPTADVCKSKKELLFCGKPDVKASDLQNDLAALLWTFCNYAEFKEHPRNIPGQWWLQSDVSVAFFRC